MLNGEERRWAIQQACSQGFRPKAATLWRVAAFLTLLPLCSCNDTGAATDLTMPPAEDQALFQRIMTDQPYTAYALFPGVDSVTSGTLNGSSAHQPLVRVSLNTAARTSFSGDTLAAGTTFKNGSIIVKQIIQGNTTVLFAVVMRDSGSPSSAAGWLWAEYHPDGAVAYSVTNRGAGCVGCHNTGNGALHDHIRTFERAVRKP